MNPSTAALWATKRLVSRSELETRSTATRTIALISISIFKFSKKYFWFGEEPVTAASLTQFLRGEKDIEYAHAVAAWSSVTGKGLLFFVKHADQKETPAGVLKLV